MAEELNVSMHTVKTHVYNLFRKIGVTNRIQAVNWAKENMHELHDKEEAEAKYIAKVVYKLAYFYIETLQLSENCDQLTKILQFIKHIRIWLIFLNLLLLNGKEDCV